jgi:hypothetical protein
LSSNYYGASFSPKIYPGQVLRARVFLPEDSPEMLQAGLYVWDDNRLQGNHGGDIPLTPGQWHELEFKIPPLQGACLSEAGIVFRNLGEPWSGSALIDCMDWNGAPDFSFDFAQERHEYGGVSQWTYLRGYWRLEDGAIHGSGVGVSESYSGDVDWTDYTLRALLTPLKGEHHLILARVQGALRSYALGLTPEGLVLYKNERVYQPVASAPFTWQLHQYYELHLQVRGDTLTGWIRGGPRLEWTDAAPHINGQIGLVNFNGCHTRFLEVEVKPA